MNLLGRSLIVMLLGAASSVAVAAVLIFLELRTGQALYSSTIWTFVPVGAIGAGLLSAFGYYLGSRVLRVRPLWLTLVAMLVVSAGTVYLMDSVEYGMLLADRGSIGDVASFKQFLVTSLANSPLRVADEGGASGDSARTTSGSSAAAPVLPAVANYSDPSVGEIGGGVQGALTASQSVLAADKAHNRFSGVAQRIDGIQAFGSGVLTHAAALELAGVQLAGFMIGGLLVYGYLRSISYCDDCSVFLSKKGEQTRYFNREREAKSSFDEFLTTAKGRKLRQSIESHSGVGSAEKSKFSEFASTVEISRCPGCQRHKLKFSARRKKGMSWKDISMLGYTAFSMEPLDVMRS